jgi:uncharacterized membrane protein
MHIYLGLLASVIGLGISSYIYRKKRTKTKLMCPREGCEQVLGSRFSTTLGIPNQLLGLAYYISIGVLYGIALSFPHLVTGWFVFTIAIFVSFGVLFSLYLIALQAFTIKAWCIWCLGSAAASFLLLVSLFGFPRAEFFTLLLNHRIWWVIIHNVGFILGLGGASITDVFFFRFLKDYQISSSEKETMDTLSSVIWAGLAILIVSGVMLYLPEQLRLNASPKFILKIIVVGVVLVNGVLLNLLVAPHMQTLSFEGTIPARRFRRLAFALGAVSLTSWYTAFFLGSLRRIHTTLEHGLLVYIGLVTIAVIGSQLYETILVKKSIRR